MSFKWYNMLILFLGFISTVSYMETKKKSVMFWFGNLKNNVTIVLKQKDEKDINKQVVKGNPAVKFNIDPNKSFKISVAEFMALDGEFIKKWSDSCRKLTDKGKQAKESDALVTYKETGHWTFEASDKDNDTKKVGDSWCS